MADKEAKRMASDVDVIVYSLSTLASWYRPPFAAIMDGVVSPHNAWLVYTALRPLLNALNVEGAK